VFLASHCPFFTKTVRFLFLHILLVAYILREKVEKKVEEEEEVNSNLD
jgi:hypothetical protein